MADANISRADIGDIHQHQLPESTSEDHQHHQQYEQQQQQQEQQQQPHDDHHHHQQQQQQHQQTAAHHDPIDNAALLASFTQADDAHHNVIAEIKGEHEAHFAPFIQTQEQTDHPSEQAQPQHAQPEQAHHEHDQHDHHYEQHGHHSEHDQPQQQQQHQHQHQHQEQLHRPREDHQQHQQPLESHEQQQQHQEQQGDHHHHQQGQQQHAEDAVMADHPMTDLPQAEPGHEGATAQLPLDQQQPHQHQAEIAPQPQEPQAQPSNQADQHANGHVDLAGHQQHTLPTTVKDETNTGVDGLIGSHTYQEMDAAQSLASNALEAQQYRATVANPNLDPSFANEASSGIADTDMQDARDGTQAQTQAPAAPVQDQSQVQAPQNPQAPHAASAADGEAKSSTEAAQHVHHQPHSPANASVHSPRHNGADRPANSVPSTPSKPVMVASRKQNSACDACRSRKVRCNREPGEEKCLHCKAKGIDCTTLYVQWATSSAKRPSKRARTSIAASEPEVDVPKPESVIEAAEKVQNRLVTYLFRRDTEYPVEQVKTITHAGLPFTSPSTSDGAAARLLHQSVSSSVKPAASTGAELQLLKSASRDAFITELIETYFSVVHIRIPLLDPDVFKKRYYHRSQELGGAPPDVLLAVVLALGAKFSQHSLIQTDREESVKELERAYNSAQGALSRGETERAHQVTGAKGGVDLPILTVPEELRRTGRNRLAEDLLVRAVEVMDRVKAHRQATVENVQACILVESLLYQPSTWSSDELSLVGKPTPSSHRSATLQSTGFWYACAVRHLTELGIHQQETVLAIKDPSVRTEVMQAWWTVCGADATSAVWNRRKALIDEEDFDTEPPSIDSAVGGEEREAGLDGMQLYAAYGGPWRGIAVVERKLADILRKPRHAADGVRVELFEEVADLLEQWGVDYLERAGVPLPEWPAHWDYLMAVSASTLDIRYHTVWIVLWECIDEFGIYGTDRSAVTSNVAQAYMRRTAENSCLVTDAPEASSVASLVAKVQDRALVAASRITSLASELYDRSYLRLDPGMLTQSLDATARFLVRFQSGVEVDTLLKCYRHLATSYEDAFEKAERIETIYRVYAERARVDATFEPGSSLAVALRRDVEREMANDGMDGLSIAAAAIENAAAVAQRQEGERVDENDLKDFSALVALAHQQSQQQQQEEQQREQQQQQQQESFVNDEEELPNAEYAQAHHHHVAPPPPPQQEGEPIGTEAQQTEVMQQGAPEPVVDQGEALHHPHPHPHPHHQELEHAQDEAASHHLPDATQDAAQVQQPPLAAAPETVDGVVHDQQQEWTQSS
ncbi:hypothetical protein ACQY0O_005459 [Thecaphora frezii]